MALTVGQRIALALVPRLAALLIRLLGATLRYEDLLAPGAVRGDAVAGPSVYAFWHRSLLVCAHRFRGKGIAILISNSFDGELIARTVERLGFRAVRGSSSRGGAIGLRGMAAAYQDGARCAFTADGPRGPAMVAKAGVVQLAELVGAEFVGTFYALPDRAWGLKTWDRFLIPKPFTRVRIAWPVLVGMREQGRGQPQIPFGNDKDKGANSSGLVGLGEQGQGQPQIPFGNDKDKGAAQMDWPLPVGLGEQGQGSSQRQRQPQIPFGNDKDKGHGGALAAVQACLDEAVRMAEAR